MRINGRSIEILGLASRYIEYSPDIHVSIVATDSSRRDASIKLFPDGTATQGAVVLERNGVAVQVAIDWTGRTHVVR